MRLKVTPQDFQVREQLDWPADSRGEHWVHVLHKEKLSTQEALSQIVLHGAVDRAAIAYAGLKDRQAITEQHLSIAGRAVELKLPGLNLRPVGRTSAPIHSRMSRGNAFAIVVRDLQPAEAARLRRNVPSLQTAGFPNYFDDQRFGCLRHGQGFAMLQVLRGDYEAALQQLIAAPSPRAITGDVRLKQALQRLWGDWEACLRTARGPIYQPLFQHLLGHPDDFRTALELLPLRLRVIHSFAYQSFLWNRAVSRMLRGGVPSAQRLRITTLAGDLLAWKYLEPEREQKLQAMSTPLFAPDGEGGSPPFRTAMVAELDNADLRPSDFRDHVVPGMVWREEPRAVFVKPRDLQPVRLEPDDLYPGRVKATLSFALPRGAYATMLLKRLFAPPFYAPDRERPERQSSAGERADRGGPPQRRSPRSVGRFERDRDGDRGYRRPYGGPARGRDDDQRFDRRPGPPPAPRSAPWEVAGDEEFEA